MKCPACGHALTQKNIDGVQLDVCDGGCGGIWFDWFELQKFDEPHEHAGELLEVSWDESVQTNHSEPFYCPRCEDTVMMRHFFSVKHEVEVDECPGCGGIWLDHGELEKIRAQFTTEEERRTAGVEHFRKEYGQEFVRMEQDSQAKQQKAQRFAQALRFICPTHYIPGKQEWGAF